jgi:hypothetical protein
LTWEEDVASIRINSMGWKLYLTDDIVHICHLSVEHIQWQISKVRACPKMTHKPDTASVRGQGGQSADTDAGASHPTLVAYICPQLFFLKTAYIRMLKIAAYLVKV